MAAPIEPPPPRDALFTRGQERELAATEIGLLVDHPGRWASTTLWPESVSEEGTPHSEATRFTGYFFYASGGGNARPVFFPSFAGLGEEQMYPFEVRGGEKWPGGVVLSLPSQYPNPYGLGRAAHFVRLGINAGRGAAATGAIVASTVHVLGGDPTPLLELAHARFREYEREQRATVAAAIESTLDQGVSLEANPPPREVGAWMKKPVEYQESMFPSWNEASGVLAVTFARSASTVECRSETRFFPAEVCNCPIGSPSCAHCQRLQPAGYRAQQRCYGAYVTLGTYTAFDRIGAKVAERVYEPLGVRTH